MVSVTQRAGDVDLVPDCWCSYMTLCDHLTQYKYSQLLLWPSCHRLRPWQCHIVPLAVTLDRTNTSLSRFHLALSTVCVSAKCQRDIYADASTRQSTTWTRRPPDPRVSIYCWLPSQTWIARQHRARIAEYLYSSWPSTWNTTQTEHQHKHQRRRQQQCYNTYHQGASGSPLRIRLLPTFSETSLSKDTATMKLHEDQLSFGSDNSQTVDTCLYRNVEEPFKNY